MSESAKPQYYDRRTVWLHWTTAVLLFALWVGAHFIDSFPAGPGRVPARSLHITFGVIVMALTVFRIYWRVSDGTRFADPSNLGRTLAKSVHVILYALILITVTLGIANVWVRGDSIFGLVHIPKFCNYDDAARKLLKNQVFEWHELAANLVLSLGIGHGFIGLWHRVVMKDNVLDRIVNSA
jgi:cytochrome b561